MSSTMRSANVISQGADPLRTSGESSCT
jgi:hypothetical protein